MKKIFVAILITNFSILALAESEKSLKSIIHTTDINNIVALTFGFIKSGKFSDGTIMNSFKIAQTETTQLQWAKVQILSGEKDLKKINPSKHQIDSSLQTVNINEIQVLMNPNYPVNNISYKDVLNWIERLNKLSIHSSSDIQIELQKIIPEHIKNDQYDLPNDLQWDFTYQNRGAATEEFFNKKDDKESDLYAWYRKNSGSMSHPVATKKPRLIDSDGLGSLIEIYDLDGNVSEWNKQSNEIEPSLNTDGIPHGVVNGTSYNDTLEDFMIYLWYQEFSSPETGFRLTKILQ